MDSYVQPMLLDKRCQFMRCAHELRNLEPWPVAYQGLYAWAGEERGVSSGVARGGAGGGSCPRAPPGGGRQNPAKEFFKIYIRRNFKNSERIK